MIDEVYEYLKEFGFTKEDLDSFENINERMYFTNLKEVTKNINFLSSKSLSKEEIINLIKSNCFLLTVKDNRLESLDNIYLNILNLNNGELKKLILLYPYTYIESPIEIEKIIAYLKENNYTIDNIKEIIFSKPEILSYKLDKIEKIFPKKED